MTSSQQGILKLWDTTSGREVFSAAIPPVTITALAFSPNGHRLAAATLMPDIFAVMTGRKVPGDIYLWDATPRGENPSPDR
jgi:WD40 repeat protein